MAQTLSSEPSRIIKYAFGLEIAANTIFGSILIASPSTALTSFARSPAFVTPTAEFLAQCIGGFILSCSAPLALGLLQRYGAGPRERKLAYWTLSAGEAVLIPVLVGKFLNGTDAGVGQPKELLGMAANLGLFLAWRLWCLGWRPQWFGTEKTGEVSLK